MQIIVVNGPLPEKEQDACIRLITRRHPASAIDHSLIQNTEPNRQAES